MSTVMDRIAPMLGHDPTERDERLAQTAGTISSLRRQAAAVEAELAALRTQFEGGYASHFEHERSSYLSQIRERIRIDKEAKSEKATEGLLDAACRAHPEYVGWLEKKRNEREVMYRLEASLAQINADIEEARMEREHELLMARRDEELLRFLRAEMGMQ